MPFGGTTGVTDEPSDTIWRQGGKALGSVSGNGWLWLGLIDLVVLYPTDSMAKWPGLESERL